MDVISVIINFDMIRAVHHNSKTIERRFAQKGIRRLAHAPSTYRTPTTC